jgi:SAM-dependent methyltransferase
MIKPKTDLIMGIYNVIDQYIYYPVMLLSDRIRGLDYYKIVVKDAERLSEAEDLYVSNPNELYNIYMYESTHLRIDRQLKKICRGVSKQDSIIDVGCGKGRMLEFFSRYRFRRVDGLELDKGLVKIARRNVKKLGLKSKVYNKDATEFTHWERYNYFYFYNPFPEDVMDVCLDHILSSLKEHPRTITALYANPACHQSFLNHGFKEIPIKLDLIERLWQPYLSGLKRYRIKV